MEISYHARTECANGVFDGTITLSIDGQLAIIDVHAEKLSQLLDKKFVTMPQAGYDLTVHHVIVWKDNVCAAAIIVVVYKDGGEVSSVTIGHNI